MFLRAFPHRPAVLRLAERILNGFHKKVEALRESAADMDAFDRFEFAGIAGTEMEDTLSFDVARWLIQRMPGQVEIAWDNYEPGRELGTTGPRFIPLLEDDANRRSRHPFRRWLETAAAKPRSKNSHKQAPRHRGMADRALRPPAASRPSKKPNSTIPCALPLRWKLGNSPITRTRNWRSVREVFYHDGPLISRSQVSLAAELAKRPPSFTRLSLARGRTHRRHDPRGHAGALSRTLRHHARRPALGGTG